MTRPKKFPDLSGKRIACCSRNYKRAALLFDWVTTATTPEEEAESSESFPDDVFGANHDIVDAVLHGDSFSRAVRYLKKVEKLEDIPQPRINSVMRDFQLVEIAAIYRRQGAISAVLDLANSQVISYSSSDRASIGVQASLSAMPVAIETELDWNQVREFRSDPDAKRKYRDLHLWLEASLIATSERQAREIIEQKLSDYGWAIKKHGIKTQNEVLTGIFGIGTLVSGIGGVATTAAAISPVYGALAGAGIATAGIIAWMRKRQYELEDIKRGEQREVAYLYEARRAIE